MIETYFWMLIVLKRKNSLNRDLINKKEKLEQEKKFYQNLKINLILRNQRKFLKKSLI